MPKTRENVIFQSSKKQPAEWTFDVQTFVLPIALGVLFFISALFFEVLITPPATAKQLSTTAQTPVLVASNLLVTPSPANDVTLPVAQTLENSLNKQATDTAVLEPPYAEDYCLNVPVVTYHHIQPMKMADLLGHAVLTADSELFDKQIQYLKDNGYTGIAAQDLVEALINKTQLPEKSIVVTIDDGYEDNYTYAFMTAKKHEFLMNFMISTDLIDTPGYMKWEHLHELAQSSYARLYNHTSTHAPLGLLNKDQITAEVAGANADLQTRLNVHNTIVTYPYGSYDNEAIVTLKELGMTGAFSTDHGSEHCLSTIMRLPRIRIGNAPMSEYGL
jgi:peptidoglycan/xylan/chitin deacetylase (PgdA/CDA1 family)